MKKTMISMLVLAVLSFGTPYAMAENSQDLDPMASPDAQATVTSDSSMNNKVVSQTNTAPSTAEAATTDKKTGKPKRKTAKKSSAKKSSSRKSSKSGSKKSRANKKDTN